MLIYKDLLSRRSDLPDVDLSLSFALFQFDLRGSLNDRLLLSVGLLIVEKFAKVLRASAHMKYELNTGKIIANRMCAFG